MDIADTIFGRTGNFTAGDHRDAIVTLSAQNITTPSTNSGIPGTDLMAIEASIYPNASGRSAVMPLSMYLPLRISARLAASCSG